MQTPLLCSNTSHRRRPSTQSTWALAHSPPIQTPSHCSPTRPNKYISTMIKVTTRPRLVRGSVSKELPSSRFLSLASKSTPGKTTARSSSVAPSTLRAKTRQFTHSTTLMMPCTTAQTPKLTINKTTQDTLLQASSTMLEFVSAFLEALSTSARLKTSSSTLLTLSTKTIGVNTVQALQEPSEWARIPLFGLFLAALLSRCSISI